MTAPSQVDLMRQEVAEESSPNFLKIYPRLGVTNN